MSPFGRQNEGRASCTGSLGLGVFSGENARYEVPGGVQSRVTRQQNAPPLPTRPENEAGQGGSHFAKRAHRAGQHEDTRTFAHRN